jgi:hypothetical protein
MMTATSPQQQRQGPAKVALDNEDIAPFACKSVQLTRDAEVKQSWDNVQCYFIIEDPGNLQFADQVTLVVGSRKTGVIHKKLSLGGIKVVLTKEEDRLTVNFLVESIVLFPADLERRKRLIDTFRRIRKLGSCSCFRPQLLNQNSSLTILLVFSCYRSGR